MSALEIVFAALGGTAALGTAWVCGVVAWRLLKSPDS
jgi:hypothetical protein